MAELKTKKTTVPISTLIASIANDAMRADEVFRIITREIWH